MASALGALSTPAVSTPFSDGKAFGGALSVSTTPTLPDVERMSPFESMQEVLFEVRDGIENLGTIFGEKISGLNKHLAFRLETLNKTMTKIANATAKDLNLEQAQFADDQSDENLDERGANLQGADTDGEGDGDGEGEEKPGMIASMKESYGNLGEKGKIALFAAIAAGLMLAATKLNKIIAPILKFFNETILPAFKRFYDVIKADIGPVIDKVVDSISDALAGLKEFFTGLIELDFDKMKKGLKKIYTEALPKFISAIGVAIFSMVDGLLAFLGFEKDGTLRKFVDKVKDFFYDFPEKFKEIFVKAIEDIKTFFSDSVTFVTETIPEFFTDMKDSIVQGIKDMISFVVDPIVQLKNDITESVEMGVDKIKEGILNVVTKIKDTFTKLVNGLKGMANAVIDKINLVLPERFEISKFEITPIDKEVVNVKVEEKTGDASVAEKVAQDERATAEGNKIRDRQDLDMRMAYTGTYEGFSNPYDINYDKDISQQGTDSALFGEEFVQEMIKKSEMAQAKLAELLENTLQNQELRANAETSKPIVMNNVSSKQGDVTNQTAITSGEIATDHNDMTAKHLADAMTP